MTYISGTALVYIGFKVIEKGVWFNEKNLLRITYDGTDWKLYKPDRQIPDGWFSVKVNYSEPIKIDFMEEIPV